MLIRERRSDGQSSSPTHIDQSDRDASSSQSHVMVTGAGDYYAKLQKYLTDKKIVSRLQQQSKLTQQGYSSIYIEYAGRRYSNLWMACIIVSRRLRCVKYQRFS